MLFIDFKKAYDSIKRTAIWKALQHLGIEPKLIRMTQLTLAHSNSKIRASGALSKSFQIGVGLRQGDGLSTILFNLVLEYVMRRVMSPREMDRSIYNSSFQILAYADDLAFMARSLVEMKELLIKLEGPATEVGLVINEDKSKYLMISRSKRSQHTGQNLTLSDSNFEKVQQFKYLGATLSGENDITPEINERIASGNRSLYGLYSVFKSKWITANTKKVIYKTVIRPAVMYGSETWTLTTKNQQALEVFERKVLRRIYGPTRDAMTGEWRARYNQELYQIFKDPIITNVIRSQRLRWTGHVLRMENPRMPKTSFISTPDGTRPRGRPRRRYQDMLDDDMKTLKVKNWRSVAVDRTEWKKVVWEAQTRQS
jgi:Reverse transcriptase (RNA-dependent DNA polymerase)